MEQAMSMVVGDQSLNVLIADTDSGSVWDFLYWLYREWFVNKLCKNIKHVHSNTSVTSKSNFNLKMNQTISCSIVTELSLNWCIDEYDWMSVWKNTAV